MTFGACETNDRLEFQSPSTVQTEEKDLEALVTEDSGNDTRHDLPIYRKRAYI